MKKIIEFRVFLGSETRQISHEGEPAISTQWYWEPVDYLGDVLWSEPFASAAEAAAAAAEAPDEDEAEDADADEDVQIAFGTPSPSACYPADEQARNGATDIPVTLWIRGRVVEGEITLFATEDGGLGPEGTPLDGWIGGTLLREIRAIEERNPEQARGIVRVLSSPQGYAGYAP